MPPPQIFENCTPATFKAVTRHDLREWVAAAQPGARMVYGFGSNASQACSTLVREFVMELYERGFLTPHRVPAQNGNPPAHIVQRSKRKLLKGEKL